MLPGLSKGIDPGLLAYESSQLQQMRAPCSMGACEKVLATSDKIVGLMKAWIDSLPSPTVVAASRSSIMLHGTGALGLTERVSHPQGSPTHIL
jgi:hypothetical protein